MSLVEILILLGAGAAGGFVAGLIGVGGGVIFAPVLLFYFERTGVAPEVLAPLTVGSSLLCTFVAALVSGWAQHREGAVDGRVAFRVGVLSAVAIALMTRFVTTQPWYDAAVFQVVFSGILLVVVVRMVRSGRARRRVERPARTGWPVLAATGTTAGVVASAAGVGGGIVLVPAYDAVLRLPIRRAVGTSSATIVLISAIGVLNYMAVTPAAPLPATAVGYVDVVRSLVLVAPAVVTARLGVGVAHRIDTRILRWCFAALAFAVALRLLYGALGG